jgi:hypothetical protein
MGVWAIVVCTEPFRGLAQLNARARKVPDLDIIVVDHPLGVRPVDQVQELGREVARQVAQLAAQR